MQRICGVKKEKGINKNKKKEDKIYEEKRKRKESDVTL